MLFEVALIEFNRVILFCTKHSLYPSVKAGGYGTAGWAIGGDIVIDLSKLVEMDIEAPHPDGSFTSLRDVAPANSKGKMPVESSNINSGKRRREDDADLRVYDSASHAVASFLRGPTLEDRPSPSVRRRLDTGAVNNLASSSSASFARQLSQESDTNSGSSYSESGISGIFSASRAVSSDATDVTSPSPPDSGGEISGSSNSVAPGASRPQRLDADPFGYLDTPNNFSAAAPPIVVHTSHNPGRSMLSSWRAGSSTAFTNAADPFTQMNLHSQAEPFHPHAFVTFGAGMRQKEIDTYTAQHKLEAHYPTGVGEGIPYHVPL